MKIEPVETQTSHFTDDYLAYLLARASMLVSRQFHAQLRGAGLRVPEWRVLATLCDRPALTIGQLAEITLLKQPTLTAVVDKMEQAGWVERRSQLADRRITQVSITPLGTRVVSGLLVQAKTHEAQVLQNYPPAEVEAMKRGLRELIARSSEAQ